MHSISNRLQTKCVYPPNIEALNVEVANANAPQLYIVICVVAFTVFVATRYLMSKRVRGVRTLFRFARCIMIPIKER